jgi:hypothetical protein
VDLPQQLTAQLKAMERLVDGQTGAILFRHPELRGIPDLVVEGDGYTLEFIGSNCSALTSRIRAAWCACWPNP